MLLFKRRAIYAFIATLAIAASSASASQTGEPPLPKNPEPSSKIDQCPHDNGEVTIHCIRTDDDSRTFTISNSEWATAAAGDDANLATIADGDAQPLYKCAPPPDDAGSYWNHVRKISDPNGGRHFHNNLAIKYVQANVWVYISGSHTYTYFNKYWVTSDGDNGWICTCKS